MNNIKNFIKLDYISIKYLTIEINYFIIVGIISVQCNRFSLFSASVLMGIIMFLIHLRQLKLMSGSIILALPNSKKILYWEDIHLYL